MIRLAVAGATGRTGRCVLGLAVRDERFQVVAALTEPDGCAAGASVHVADRDVPVVTKLDTPCDVLIDFTLAEGTMAWLDVCVQRGIAMVIGATGHSDEQLTRLREAGTRIPILKAPNFSVGINAMRDIVRRLAQALGDEYDVEVVETHHGGKVDAPSGTAHALVDELLAASGRARDGNVVSGRSGHTGARPAGQIGVHSVRMGRIVGWHEVHFSGPGETVSIRHTAHSRETFAAGALRAAAWLAGKKPGNYSMRDVIE